MAISVTKYPALITGVKNPVVFEMVSDHYITGEYAALDLRYPGDEHLGANYILDLFELDETMTFSCVLNPDNSGYQFPTRQGESMEEWIDIVCSYLQMNTLLISYFTIISMPQEHAIRIEAKERGYQYSPSFSIGNSVLTIQDMKITMGADDQEKLNHMIGLQVWRRLDGVDTKLSEDLAPGLIVDGNLIVQFNIAEILAAHCTSAVNSVESPFYLFTDRNQMNPPYFIKYYEQYGGNIVELIISRWFFSLNGGIPSWKELPFYMDYRSLKDYFMTTRKYFLTWCDFAKQTDVDAPERLYLLFPVKPTATNFVLRITKHFFDDGDEISDIPIHKTIYAGEVFELYVSVRKLMNPVPENLSGYDIQFRASDNSYYSAVFQFTIDPVFRPYLRHFVFKNSFGAFECIRLFGIAEQEVSYKREYISQSVLEEYTSGMIPSSQQDPDIVRSLKLTTGYQCGSYCDWIQDFLASTEVYQVDASVWIPATVTVDKVVLSKDSKHQSKIDVTIQYPDHANVFQREKTVAWSTVSSVGNPYS